MCRYFYADEDVEQIISMKNPREICKYLFQGESLPLSCSPSRIVAICLRVVCDCDLDAIYLVFQVVLARFCCRIIG